MEVPSNQNDKLNHKLTANKTINIEPSHNNSNNETVTLCEKFGPDADVVEMVHIDVASDCDSLSQIIGREFNKNTNNKLKEEDSNTITEENINCNQEPRNLIPCQHFFSNGVGSSIGSLRSTNENNLNNNSINFQSIGSSNTSSSGQSATFKFKDNEKMRYDIRTVIAACPTLSGIINRTRGEVTVNLPDWISQTELLEYFFYFKNFSAHNFSIQARKLLQIADFFDNQELIQVLIKNEILPYLNVDNSLQLLEDSFQKLSCSNDFERVKTWYDLFIAAVDMVAGNFDFHIVNHYNKMKHLNKKLLEEIIEKNMAKKILNFNTSDWPGGKFKPDKFSSIFEFVYILRNYTAGNVYDLLLSEYLRISSEESVKEIDSLGKPTFSVNLNKEMKHYYEEFNISFNELLSITIVVYYKKSDDSLNVSFKINPSNKRFLNSLPVFTFLSITQFREEPEKKQIAVKSVGSAKSLLSIFKINQFRQNFLNTGTINSRSKYSSGSGSSSKNLTLCVYLKICYIHSTLTNYILRNFDMYYKEAGINKISKQLLGIMFTQFKNIQNNSNRFLDEDIFVEALTLWLNDEINLHEDNLKDLLDLIDWNKVTLDLFCQFLMKFNKLIEHCDMENHFQGILESRMANFANSPHSINGIQRISQNSIISNLNTNTNVPNGNNPPQISVEEVIKRFSNLFMRTSKSINYVKLLSENIKFAKFSPLSNNSPLCMSRCLSDKELESISIGTSRLMNFFSDEDENFQNSQKSSRNKKNIGNRCGNISRRNSSNKGINLDDINIREDKHHDEVNPNFRISSTKENTNNIQLIQYFQVKPEYTNAFLKQLNPQMIELTTVDDTSRANNMFKTVSSNRGNVRNNPAVSVSTIEVKEKESESKEKVRLKETSVDLEGIKESGKKSNLTTTRSIQSSTLYQKYQKPKGSNNYYLKKSNFNSNVDSSKENDKIFYTVQPSKSQAHTAKSSILVEKNIQNKIDTNINKKKNFDFYDYSTTINKNKINTGTNTDYNSRSSTYKNSLATSKNIKNSIEENSTNNAFTPSSNKHSVTNSIFNSNSSKSKISEISQAVKSPNVGVGKKDTKITNSTTNKASITISGVNTGNVNKNIKSPQAYLGNTKNNLKSQKSTESKTPILIKNGIGVNAKSALGSRQGSYLALKK